MQLAHTLVEDSSVIRRHWYWDDNCFVKSLDKRPSSMPLRIRVIWSTEVAGGSTAIVDSDQELAVGRKMARLLEPCFDNGTVEQASG